LVKIKMISGIYGYLSNGHVMPKTAGSGPFEVDEKTAERLINTGAAERVREAGTEVPVSLPEKPEAREKSGKNTGIDKPPDLFAAPPEG
jgi:hypothetical protein